MFNTAYRLFRNNVHICKFLPGDTRTETKTYLFYILDIEFPPRLSLIEYIKDVLCPCAILQITEPVICWNAVFVANFLPSRRRDNKRPHNQLMYRASNGTVTEGNRYMATFAKAAWT